jgi:hypothetical protein
MGIYYLMIRPTFKQNILHIKHWFVPTVTRLLLYEIGHKISLQSIYCAIFNPNETNSGLTVQASHYISIQPPP